MKCPVFSIMLSTGLVLASMLLTVLSKPAAPSGRGDLPGMPKDCNGKRFCTLSHPSYPQDIIENLLKQKQISLGAQYVPYGKRVSDDSGFEVGDCRTHQADYTKIFWILDDSNTTRVVVQGGNFLQQVRIEECLKPGELTHNTIHFDELVVKHHNITCSQKTMNYKFLVLNEEMTGFDTTTLELPVYCACVWRNLRLRT